MENQHRHIKGYRELTEDEVKLMNMIKEKGTELGALIAGMEQANLEAHAKLYTAEWSTLENRIHFQNQVSEAMRWTGIGKDQIQQGLMALTRSVALPESF